MRALAPALVASSIAIAAGGGAARAGGAGADPARDGGAGARPAASTFSPQAIVAGAAKAAGGGAPGLVLGVPATSGAAPPAPAPAGGAGSPTPSGATASAPAGAGGVIGGCVDSVPGGATRPILTETFPDRGTTGYAAILRISVEHGKGETVLPRGLELQSAGDAAKFLRDASFVVPDQDGGGAARLTPGEADPKKPDRAVTVLELPLVPLPKDPGRQVLRVPPLPVAVARASGEIASVCTKPHSITVEDPTASTPDARPKPNPPAVPQREEWTSLKRALQWIAAGAVLGAILAYALRRWMKRPRPVPPPPPPRPPWEVALEQLDEVRHAGLLDVERYGEYFDRVNDALRKYLGDRYGFDGLESTTDEILGALEKARLDGDLSRDAVRDFLRECDLVKFANVTPTPEECRRALDAGEKIVRSSMPDPAPRRGEAHGEARP